MSWPASVGIVGLGLIGGSIAAAVRKFIPDCACLGYDTDPGALRIARDRSFVQRTVARSRELQTDFIVIAVPLRIAAAVTATILAEHRDSTVINVASVQSPLIPLLSAPGGDRLVLTHPMAGKELGGIANADPELFRGKPWAICLSEAEASERLVAVADWIGKLGARARYVPLAHHDAIVARTSHLPQLLSSLLAAGLNPRADAAVASLSGPGLASMTRLAGSSWELWRDIFIANRPEIECALAEFRSRVASTESEWADIFRGANEYYELSNSSPPLPHPRRARWEVVGLSTTGDGVIHTPAGARFVAGVLPGDVIEVADADAESKTDAPLLRIIEPSAHRVSHPCRHHLECVASPWGALDYAIQLEQKQELVARTLRKQIGEVSVGATVPSPRVWGYRQRLTPTVWRSASGIEIGFRTAARGRAGTPVVECKLALPVVSRALSFIADQLRRLGLGSSVQLPARIQVHTTASGAGALLVFRGGCDSRTLRDWQERLAGPALAGGIHIVRGNAAGLPAARRALHIPAKSEPMSTSFAGRVLELHPLAFCQANADAADLVHTHLGSTYAALPLRRVWDLYGGYGALGIAAAGTRAALTVAEFTAHSEPTFTRLAESLGVTAAEFIGGDLRDVMTSISARIAADDLVILDPPHSGVHPEILTVIAQSAARRVCYLSCNPARLGRDLRHLLAAGFRLDELTPYDFFPHTASIETLARLSR